DKDSLAGGEAAAEKARQAIPHATVRVWPNTTHSLPFQVPQELGAELGSFWAAE
ncbi:alpha/beta hydrolase, partial [Corynebacterium sanguinis]|nr:alpha/beta hydrolase [Corynebacterium sanguinis]